MLMNNFTVLNFILEPVLRPKTLELLAWLLNLQLSKAELYTADFFSTKLKCGKNNDQR